MTGLMAAQGSQNVIEVEVEFHESKEKHPYNCWNEVKTGIL